MNHDLKSLLEDVEAFCIENETVIPKMDTMVTKWYNKKRRKTPCHH
jgi:hypothetical protein